MPRTRYTVDSDGDVEMTVPQPVYEFICAPQLAKWEQGALIVWYRDWKHYKDKIKQRCSVTGEDYASVISTVKGAVKPEVLQTMARFLLKGKPVESVTDDEILQLVRQRCQTLKNEYIPDIKTLFKRELRMDLSLDDCDARVFQYFQDFTRIVEENGLQGLIGSADPTSSGHKDRMKKRCRLLVETLQPALLQDQIQRLIEFERRDCRTDDVALFDLILEHAKAQQRFFNQSKDSAATAKAKGGTPATAKPPAAKPNKEATTKASAGRPQPVTPRAPKTATPPTEGCLFCKGPHWLRECPTATVEQRRAALEKFKEDKQQRVGPIRSKAVGSGNAAYTVKINGSVEVPYLPDTGADCTILPSSVLRSLEAAAPPHVDVHRMSRPVTVILADGTTKTCAEEVKLDLQLTTAAGVVHVRQVPCLVLDSEDDELLLGRDTLSSLGIDVNDMLAQLAGSALLATEEDEFPVGYELFEEHITGALAEPDAAVMEMVDAAVRNGYPADRRGELEEILMRTREVWSTQASAGPPAGVEPLQVTLREDAVPFRCHGRNYPPLQAEFIRGYIRQLLERGLIRKNNASKWASAVVPVRKPGIDNQFRLTIDYRPVNAQTAPVAGRMPTQGEVIDAVRGAKFYARFDLPEGFWQFPLHENSQEIFSFLTPDGVFSPLRVPQGATDSALHFQAQMQTVLAPMIPRNVICWIDDILIFAKDMDSFLAALQEFFDIIGGHGLKLHPSKSSLFESEVKWCGRLISGDGIRHDPARVEALTTLPLPSTVAELQYFVCAANWLHESMPDFARVVAPLQDKLQAERSKLGRRSRNALNVALQWTDVEEEAYERVIALIRDSALMTFPDDDCDVCLFVDASQEGYAIILTQVPEWNEELTVEEQDHRLIVCKGGVFRDSQLRWPIIDKEAYPIVKACQDLSYVLQRANGFRLFCDHSNLIYVFAPKVELKKHVRDRLQRWAMRLCGMRYTIEHIPGTTNLWADIVSRWRASPSVMAAAVRTRRDRPAPVISLSQLRPLADSEFVFPTLEDVREAQVAAGRRARDGLQQPAIEEEGVVMVEGKPWIPTAAKDLLSRVFVVAHCGSQGHRGQEVMCTVLSERFYIPLLAKKVSTFIKNCLLCKHVKGAKQIQRPYGPTFTATKRNEALHYDFLSLGEDYGENSYVLVLKDGLTHFCELFPCASPTAFVAAESLLEWYKRFGCPDLLMSDQGTHFRNHTIELLCSRLKIEPQFSPVYSPWLNGTVERLNKDILQVMRALLIEHGLDFHEWSYLLPVVQANLNHTPVRSLGGHAPIELFTGLPAPSALDSIVRPTSGREEVLEINMDKSADLLDKLRGSLHELHKEVLDLKERKRLQDMAAHRGTPCNFDVGDFVLWSRVDQRLTGNKLLGQWVGPFQVIRTRPHSFVIKHLVTAREFEVHGTRLKYYADKDFNITAEILEFTTQQGMLLGVKAIKEHRYNAALKRWELLVSWCGLQDVEDSWESLAAMLKDVPAKVTEYANDSDDAELMQQLE
ncbi:unnamed protein product [Phytophthora fragariaefolia]|uniref:RNA-directed DNA polymerase n=1 Tax=Phytophthora fragariaefolia TaxID=1490495 RepID=A0A9W7CQB2_9STRA|nr:unnamed protein product [Phytophthora fragariaefolia]